MVADGAGTERCGMALGENVVVAFMPWYGHNFEDAIVLSERLVKDDVYSSIHIQELELHVRDTKRGREEITREIPDRKSTRLNSSHLVISYAVFCLKKKKTQRNNDESH